MRIRKEQLAFFSVKQEQGLSVRLADFLQQQFSEAAKQPRDELVSQLNRQIGKSRRYGMRTEQQVAAYVITAWLLGTDFDEAFPAARQVLTADIPGEMKARFIEKWTLEMFDELERG